LALLLFSCLACWGLPSPETVYYNIAMSRGPSVSASEVGDYVFCQRCWWLRLRGLKPARFTPAMQEGTQAHNQLQADVRQVFQLRTAAAVLIVFGLLMVVIVLLLKTIL